ncbi:MAG: hypothetical protein ABI760_19330 [Ferruginibacter sp.]
MKIFKGRRIIASDGLLAEGVNDISNAGTRHLVVMKDYINYEPRPLNLEAFIIKMEK